MSVLQPDTDRRGSVEELRRLRLALGVRRRQGTEMVIYFC